MPSSFLEATKHLGGSSDPSQQATAPESIGAQTIVLNFPGFPSCCTEILIDFEDDHGSDSKGTQSEEAEMWPPQHDLPATPDEESDVSQTPKPIEDAAAHEFDQSTVYIGLDSGLTVGRKKARKKTDSLVRTLPILAHCSKRWLHFRGKKSHERGRICAFESGDVGKKIHASISVEDRNDSPRQKFDTKQTFVSPRTPFTFVNPKATFSMTTSHDRKKSLERSQENKSVKYSSRKSKSGVGINEMKQEIVHGEEMEMVSAKKKYGPSMDQLQVDNLSQSQVAGCKRTTQVECDISGSHEKAKKCAACRFSEIKNDHCKVRGSGLDRLPAENVQFSSQNSLHVPGRVPSPSASNVASNTTGHKVLDTMFIDVIKLMLAQEHPDNAKTSSPLSGREENPSLQDVVGEATSRQQTKELSAVENTIIRRFDKDIVFDSINLRESGSLSKNVPHPYEVSELHFPVKTRSCDKNVSGDRDFSSQYTTTGNDSNNCHLCCGEDVHECKELTTVVDTASCSDDSLRGASGSNEELPTSEHRKYDVQESGSRIHETVRSLQVKLQSTSVGKNSRLVEPEKPEKDCSSATLLATGSTNAKVPPLLRRFNTFEKHKGRLSFASSFIGKAKTALSRVRSRSLSPSALGTKIKSMILRGRALPKKPTVAVGPVKRPRTLVVSKRWKISRQCGPFKQWIVSKIGELLGETAGSKQREGSVEIWEELHVRKSCNIVIDIRIRRVNQATIRDGNGPLAKEQIKLFSIGPHVYVFISLKQEHNRQRVLQFSKFNTSHNKETKPRRSHSWPDIPSKPKFILPSVGNLDFSDDLRRRIAHIIGRENKNLEQAQSTSPLFTMVASPVLDSTAEADSPSEESKADREAVQLKCEQLFERKSFKKDSLSNVATLGCDIGPCPVSAVGVTRGQHTRGRKPALRMSSSYEDCKSESGNFCLWNGVCMPPPMKTHSLVSNLEANQSELQAISDMVIISQEVKIKRCPSFPNLTAINDEDYSITSVKTSGSNTLTISVNTFEIDPFPVREDGEIKHANSSQTHAFSAPNTRLEYNMINNGGCTVKQNMQTEFLPNLVEQVKMKSGKYSCSQQFTLPQSETQVNISFSQSGNGLENCEDAVSSSRYLATKYNVNNAQPQNSVVLSTPENNRSEVYADLLSLENTQSQCDFHTYPLSLGKDNPSNDATIDSKMIHASLVDPNTSVTLRQNFEDNATLCRSRTGYVEQANPRDAQNELVFDASLLVTAETAYTPADDAGASAAVRIKITPPGPFRHTNSSENMLRNASDCTKDSTVKAKTVLDTCNSCLSDVVTEDRTPYADSVSLDGQTPKTATTASSEKTLTSEKRMKINSKTYGLRFVESKTKPAKLETVLVKTATARKKKQKKKQCALQSAADIPRRCPKGKNDKSRNMESLSKCGAKIIDGDISNFNTTGRGNQFVVTSVPSIFGAPDKRPICGLKSVKDLASRSVNVLKVQSEATDDEDSDTLTISEKNQTQNFNITKDLKSQYNSIENQLSTVESQTLHGQMFNIDQVAKTDVNIRFSSKFSCISVDHNKLDGTAIPYNASDTLNQINLSLSDRRNPYTPEHVLDTSTSFCECAGQEASVPFPVKRFAGGTIPKRLFRRASWSDRTALTKDYFANRTQYHLRRCDELLQRSTGILRRSQEMSCRVQRQMEYSAEELKLMNYAASRPPESRTGLRI